MPAKIVFIGAGSLGFTRSLVRDCLTFPTMRDAHIVLVDIDPERLRMAKASCRRIVSVGQYPARITATTDRRKALKDADAVLTTILSGGVDVWQHDILIPKQYGVDINVGDTRGPSGIFRALRTIPEMLAICRDIEALCPQAVMLNYTNPMAMLCQAMQKTTRVNVTGLCHSVQGTAAMLAGWAGVPADEVDYVCAGINHLSWYLSFTHQGRDLYPALRRRVRTDKAIYNAEQVRNELFMAFDYYVTESSGHNSEYNWWFRKRPELIEKYCTHGTNWNPGKHAYILEAYAGRTTRWKRDIRDWINQDAWNHPRQRKQLLARGGEYASRIIDAWLGGGLFRFNGNVPNTGIIPNLPQNACVEVPVFANRRGFNPTYVGPLPPQLAALNNVSVAVEEMAVEAALTGNPEMAFHAVAYDPLTAAVLSLAETRKMVQEMLIRNRDHLPQFRNVKIT